MSALKQLSNFKSITCVDFEFGSKPGERPTPICVVAQDVPTGQTTSLFEDELLATRRPPYGCGPDDLFVAYFATAELGCHLALGWPLPVNIVDLYVEFRVQTNGLKTPCGNGLLGAMAFYGLDAMATSEKETMRDLALRGGPWTTEERTNLLDYCKRDVLATVELWRRMATCWT